LHESRGDQTRRPLDVARIRLTEAGVDAVTLGALAERAHERVRAAVTEARLSAEPTLQSAIDEVYATGVAR